MNRFHLLLTFLVGLAVGLVCAGAFQEPAPIVFETAPQIQKQNEAPVKKRSSTSNSKQNNLSSAVVKNSSKTVVVEQEILEPSEQVGFITGKVTTSLGRPIEGALIEDSKDPSLRTATDTSGNFRLQVSKAQTYSFEATHKDWLITPAPGYRSKKTQAGDVINFVAQTQVILPLKVLMPDGRLAPKAQVECTQSVLSINEKKDWQAQDPQIKLKPGIWDLKATYANQWASERRQVSLKKGVRPESLTLKLNALTGIRGRVILADGLYSKGLMYLYHMPLSGRVDTDKELLQASGQKKNLSNRNHSFELYDLKPGSYLLGVGLRGSSIETTQVIQVEQGQVKEVTFEITAPSQDEAISLLVLSPDGEPLENVDIRAQRFHKAFKIQRITEGLFYIYKHEKWFQDINQKIALTLASAEYGKKSVDIDAQTRELTVQFDPPTFLEVLLEGYAGSGYEGSFNVSLKPSKNNDGDSFGFRSSRTGQDLDSQGKATFGPLAPGNYTVALNAKSNSFGEVVETTEVQLSSGKNTRNLKMPTFYAVTVEGVDPEKNPNLILQKKGGGFFRRIPLLPGQSSIKIENLVEGDYRLGTSHWSPDTGQVEFSVPGTTLIPFEPSQVNAVEITIEEPQGYLAQQGFQSGDLIVEINGKEFKGMQQFYLFTMGLSDQTLSVTVVRGDQKLNKSLDPEKIKAGEIGGSLDSTSWQPSP